MKRFRKILHPTDFSKASGAAFKKAVELARQERAALRLVHVLAPPAVLLEDSFMTAKTWAELTTAGRREAQRRLAPSSRRRGRRASARARPSSKAWCSRRSSARPGAGARTSS